MHAEQFVCAFKFKEEILHVQCKYSTEVYLLLSVYKWAICIIDKILSSPYYSFNPNFIFIKNNLKKTFENLLSIHCYCDNCFISFNQNNFILQMRKLRLQSCLNSNIYKVVKPWLLSPYVISLPSFLPRSLFFFHSYIYWTLITCQELR